MKKFISIVSIFFLCISQVFAVTSYVSIDEEGNGGSGGTAVQEAIMQDVDLLDDGRVSQFAPGSNFEAYTFSGDLAGGIEANYGTQYFDMIYSNGAIVRVERVDVDGTTTGTVNATNANPKIDFGSDMQDSAPKPYSLSGAGFWNEPSGGASSNRNALLFTFTGVAVDGFGFWLGDTESRSDGSGTVADIQYFDTAGVLLSTGVVFAASGVDQSLCGGSSSSSPAACGNKTTRFVGFKKSSSIEDIKYMRVIVGDDDDENDPGTTDGNSEHLSFMGPTVVEESLLPDLGLVKTGSTTVMSGDAIGYTLVVTNHGPGAASGVVVEEDYSAGFTFVSALPVPTSGDSIWNIGAMASGAVYSIAITGSLAGMTGDYLNTARVSAETESGSVVNTGTHITSVVCNADYGTTCVGAANVCGATLTGTIACDGTCNALDAMDPVGLDTACTIGLGVCAAAGVLVCDDSGFGTACNAVMGTPADTDICDGLDNDCDGEIDEDFVGIATSCGVGECGATGMTVCEAGEIVDTCEVGTPSEEVCDLFDNDCDGEVDEEEVCIAPTTDLTISIECSPEISLTGAEMECEVIYSNNGSIDAEDTQITVDFPENIHVTALPVIPGVTCTFGSIQCGGSGYTLAAGESVAFVFDALVTGDDGDVFSIDTQIVATTSETNYSNNDDADAIQIYASSHGGGNGSSNYCGDGIVRNGEQCDDGNNLDTDGCSANCALENTEVSEPVLELLHEVFVPTPAEDEIIELIQVMKTQEPEELLFNSASLMPAALDPVALPDFLPKTGASL